jgi:hypothetical protein
VLPSILGRLQDRQLDVALPAVLTAMQSSPQHVAPCGRIGPHIMLVTRKRIRTVSIEADALAIAILDICRIAKYIWINKFDDGKNQKTISTARWEQYAK